MDSMKMLALLETRKLGRLLPAQQQVVDSIKAVAADFHHFYPPRQPLAQDSRHIYLLMGSQRGFCGDFNETVLKALETALKSNPSPSPFLIAVGRKLCLKLEGDPRAVALLEGANMAEEIEEVLSRLVNALDQFREPETLPPVTLLHHRIHPHHPTTQGLEPSSANPKGSPQPEVQLTPLLPPFQELLPPIQFASPPLLNLSPQNFFTELVDHYLFAALHEICYASLMAENYHRMQHLEGAIHRLEEKISSLALKSNTLRQEEIIEEIEVILLSAETMIPGLSP